MKIIEMTCPKCKANLEIDSSSTEFTCKFCRTNLLLNDETIKIEHIVQDQNVLEKIKVAKTYLKDFEDYQKAYEKFKIISEEHPYEPESWWGLILCKTRNFSKISFSKDEGFSVDLSTCNDYFYKYLRIEKNLARKENNAKKYTQYISDNKKYIKAKITEILNLEDYYEAYNILKRLSKINKAEPEIWWGLILCITEKLSNKSLDYKGESTVDIELCDEYFDKYLKLEDDEEQKEIKTIMYFKYKKELEDFEEEAAQTIENAENDISKIIVITIFIIFLTPIIILLFQSLRN